MFYEVRNEPFHSLSWNQTKWQDEKEIHIHLHIRTTFPKEDNVSPSHVPVYNLWHSECILFAFYPKSGILSHM